MADEKKPDLVLKDGREITFDLDQMTFGQWQGIFSPRESDERTDKTIARVCGLTLPELKALKFTEYKRLFAKLLARAQEPLSDPNA